MCRLCRYREFQPLPIIRPIIYKIRLNCSFPKKCISACSLHIHVCMHATNAQRTRWVVLHKFLHWYIEPNWIPPRPNARTHAGRANTLYRLYVTTFINRLGEQHVCRLLLIWSVELPHFSVSYNPPTPVSYGLQTRHSPTIYMYQSINSFIFMCTCTLTHTYMCVKYVYYTHTHVCAYKCLGIQVR